MASSMPSPIGHTLAALAIRWAGRPASADRDPSTRARLLGPLTVACVAVAVLPDIDLLFYRWHRTVTHSIGATLVLMIIAAAVTGKVTRRIVWRTVLLVGAAHASHILLDWLGVDRFPPRGLQAFWPFSHDWYISEWDLFLPTERRHALSAASLLTNLRAVTREIVVLAPIAVLAWVATRRRRSRAPTFVPADPQPPSAAAAGTAGTSDRQAPREAR
jgi:LexA-binding, inner membrane-associated putative hydrolase